MKKERPEGFNAAQAQIKIFEAVTESMGDRINQYAYSQLGKRTEFNYETMAEQLLIDIALAVQLCRKLEND